MCLICLGFWCFRMAYSGNRPYIEAGRWAGGLPRDIIDTMLHMDELILSCCSAFSASAPQKTELLELTEARLTRGVAVLVPADTLKSWNLEKRLH